jgi:PAS domain S-box-containing protein
LRAEERLRRQGRDRKSGADTQRLVHELRVHQIELEMQNEELRHAQRELEASRETYVDLYELAPVGYLTLNEPGRILEANLTAARLLGVARKDLVRQPFTRFILREDLGIFHQHRQQLFETRAPQSCELRLTRPGGAPFWVLGEALLAQDHKTGAPMCRMTLSDITERKQGEETLTRQLEILNATPDFIGFADAQDTRILYINPAGRKMIGWGAEEDVTRLKIAEVHPAWTNRLFREQVFPIVIRDGVWKGDVAFLRRDGREIPVTMVLVAHKSPGGKVERFSTISRDITERKQAEADRERLAQFERLAQLMQCANDTILLTDEHGRILEANDRALETYGYSLAELRQKTIEDLRTPESRAELPHQIEQLETDGRAVFEAMNQRRDGAAFPVEISARFIEIDGVPHRLSIVRDITRRKRAEEALRAIEARYRAVLEDQTEVIGRFREDGTFTFVNDVFCHFFGKSAEELLGKRWQPVVVAEDLPCIEEKLRSMSPANPVVVVENRVYSGTGQLHWMQFLDRGFFDLQGRLTEIQCVGRDITDRKRAEEALRESEARYRSLFDNMVEGFAYCRMLFEDGRPQDFIYVEVNEAFQILTGLKNVTGRKVSEVIPGLRETDPELLERYGRVALTGQTERFETYVAALKMWFSISVYCPKKEHFIAVFDVITERKQMEEKLRASEHRYRELIENQSEGVGIVDAQERFVFSNPAGDELFGLLPGSLVGRTLKEFTAPDQYARVLEQTKVRRKGTKSTYELEIIRADGQRRWLQVVAAPRSDSAGEFVGTFWIFRDITERKQAEKKMQMFSQDIIAAREEERKRVSSVLHHDVGSLTVGGFSPL